MAPQSAHHHGGAKWPAAAGALLGAAVGLRILYVLIDRGSDPTFARPMLDGAYYLAWAHRIAGGGPFAAGAFYLAPLYPILLAGFLRLFGEAFTLLYLCQQMLGVGAALLLGGAASRIAGKRAGWCAAALFLLYHPFLYFASRPLGEPLALFLLAASIRALVSASPWRGAEAAGFLAGAAALARPNLLLAPLAWAAGDLARKRWVRAGLIVAGACVAVLPVAVRNLAASGHLVAISSNGGLTLYHGNGPGAVGAYVHPEGFSGQIATQREEAAAMARSLSGRAMDEVEADRWWGRQALRARLADPLGSVALFARKLFLLFDDHEHGLDYPPALDANPLRWIAPVPFAVILALATAAVVLLGWRGSGGWTAWGAAIACGVAPVAFYASSRYRLPMAAVLCIPAGAGLAALASRALWRERDRRLAVSLAAAAIVAVVSLAVPSSDLSANEESVYLANRASILKAAGDLPAAEADAARALTLDPGSVPARFNLAVIVEAQGRTAEAEKLYRETLARDPSSAEAAANLAKILIGSGRAGEAVPVLRAALARRPYHTACWTNLVVALVTAGEPAAARGEAEKAMGLGLRLDPALYEAVGIDPGGGAPREDRRRKDR